MKNLKINKNKLFEFIIILNFIYIRFLIYIRYSKWKKLVKYPRNKSVIIIMDEKL